MNLKSIASAVAAGLAKTMEVAEVLAPVMPLGAKATELVKMASTVGAGLVNAEPAIEGLYEEIKAIAAGRIDPVTPEQWAKWNAAADQTHHDLQALLKA